MEGGQMSNPPQTQEEYERRYAEAQEALDKIDRKFAIAAKIAERVEQQLKHLDYPVHKVFLGPIGTPVTGSEIFLESDECLSKVDDFDMEQIKQVYLKHIHAESPEFSDVTDIEIHWDSYDMIKREYNGDYGLYLSMN